MNEDLFMKEYLSVWNLSDEYLRAYELWIWYQFNCEKYDRSICTGNYDKEGFIMPLTNQERRYININAYNQLMYIENKAKEYGIAKDNWFKAKRDVEHLTWDGIQQEYKRLGFEI